jgi:hypothetical protein
MKVQYCDVCRKDVEDPIPGRSFFYIANVDLCEGCKDDLELAMKQTIRGHDPFDKQWYDDLQTKLMKEGIQRGKIAVAKR